METSSNEPLAWNPDPRFPAEPEFYRRVLHYLPTPILVVNRNGEVIYGNEALVRLGGWDTGSGTGTDVVSYLHPEDRDRLATAFAELVDSPGARVLGTGRPWAEIYCRMVAADGTTIPIEITGRGGVLDPAVGGIIYEVRPAQAQSLLGRVLDGLSHGASMHQLLSLVTEMIAGPPLDLEAAILQSAPDGSLLIAASTSPALTDIIRSAQNGVPWSSIVREPEFVPLEALPEPTADRLRAAGFVDIWHVAVESPLAETTLRIVTAAFSHHVPATGPLNRIVRSRELASAVLLRTQVDVLLEHAADHDALTGLPNRAAFHQLAESVNPLIERGAILLDLDGLTTVNREHGPAIGDAVLQVVADRTRSTCALHDVVGRIGDDEFAILLSPGPDDIELADRALGVAQQILAAIEEPIVVAGRPLSISASLGLALATSGISTDHLLTWADAAMHDAKSAGGGRICRFGISHR